MKIKFVQVVALTGHRTRDYDRAQPVFKLARHECYDSDVVNIMIAMFRVVSIYN